MTRKYYPIYGRHMQYELQHPVTVERDMVRERFRFYRYCNKMLTDSLKGVNALCTIHLKRIAELEDMNFQLAEANSRLKDGILSKDTSND